MHMPLSNSLLLALICFSFYRNKEKHRSRVSIIYILLAFDSSWQIIFCLAPLNYICADLTGLALALSPLLVLYQASSVVVDR